MPSGHVASAPLEQALALHRAGQHAQALPLYEQALASEPTNRAALYYGAMAARSSGLLDLALQRFVRLLALDPAAPAEVHYHHGLTLAELGSRLEAEQAYRRCLTAQANFVPALHNLGNLLREQGQLREAETLLDRALSLSPEQADLWHSRALVRELAARPEAAVEDLRQCLQREPEHRAARALLVSLLLDLGQQSQALALARAGVRRQAQALAAWMALAEAEDACGDTTAARAAYEQAARLEPSSLALALNQGLLASEDADPDAAASIYRRVTSRPDALAARLRLACLLPVIPASETAIDEARADMTQRLQALREDSARLQDPVHEFAELPFYLSYHGRHDDKTLLGLYAQVLRQLAPALEFTAPHLGRTRRPGRWRLGVCTAHLHEHSVGRSLHALLAALPRENFELHLLRCPPFVDDARARQLDRYATAHRLPASLKAAQEAIAALELDWLLFPDVGMESLSHYLAHARLAPVQWTTLGHPCTTGLPTIDGFLSYACLETEASLATYGETPIILPEGLPYPDYPATLPEGHPYPSRKALGLPEKPPLAVLPQSLFKLMPQFDPVLVELLERCPELELLLPEPTRPGQKLRFLERLREQGADTRRLRFFARCDRARFIEMIHACDLMLDPFPVSGGISTWDALVTGTPIVTMPGALARSRLTAAALSALGDPESIVGSRQDYLRLALDRLAMRPANDPGRRAEYAERARSVYADRLALPHFLAAVETAVAGV